MPLSLWFSLFFYEYDLDAKGTDKNELVRLSS